MRNVLQYNPKAASAPPRAGYYWYIIIYIYALKNGEMIGKCGGYEAEKSAVITYHKLMISNLLGFTNDKGAQQIKSKISNPKFGG